MSTLIVDRGDEQSVPAAVPTHTINHNEPGTVPRITNAERLYNLL